MSNIIPLDFKNKYQDSNGGFCLPSDKRFFDCMSHEFKKESIEQKALILSRLIHYGFDLQIWIMAYQDKRADYVLSTLSDTLLSYIQTLRWGEPIHQTSDFLYENMSQVELAMLLEEELKARYTIWESIREDELIFSQWDERMFNDICLLANGDKEKFTEILATANFSREHKNDNRL